MLAHAVGVLGMAVIEASYVPQIARLHRLKRSDEVSLLFPAMNLAGRLIALSYSVWAGNPVFVAGFLLGAALRATLLVQVAWYRR